MDAGGGLESLGEPYPCTAAAAAAAAALTMFIPAKPPPPRTLRELSTKEAHEAAGADEDNTTTFTPDDTGELADDTKAVVAITILVRFLLLLPYIVVMG